MNRFLYSFVYAWNGMVAAFREQPNVQIHCVITAAVVGAGFYFHITPTEWALVIGCITLVVCLEMVNTAIEYLVDLVTLERNPLAGKIKDIASGAVLIGGIGSVVIGILVFYKYVVAAFL